MKIQASGVDVGEDQLAGWRLEMMRSNEKFSSILDTYTVACGGVALLDLARFLSLYLHLSNSLSLSLSLSLNAFGFTGDVGLCAQSNGSARCKKKALRTRTKATLLRARRPAQSIVVDTFFNRCCTPV